MRTALHPLHLPVYHNVQPASSNVQDSSRPSVIVIVAPLIVDRKLLRERPSSGGSLFVGFVDARRFADLPYQPDRDTLHLFVHLVRRGERDGLRVDARLCW